METITKDLNSTFFNKGRYCYKKEITKIDDWNSIFKHVIEVPPAIYDTAQLIYDKEFLGASLALLDLGSERTTRLLTLLKDAPQDKASHKSRYPDVMYIPLYCSLLGFRRCILFVETIEMDQLFIPVEVTYHINHPVAKGMELFFNSSNECIFITDNEIIHYYTVQNKDCLRRIKRLINETDNFEEFNQSFQLPLSNLLPDPERVAYAKSNINYCDPDVDPIGFKEYDRMWKEIVYPKSCKEAFLQFIFNQINIHRREQIKWEFKNPEIFNPFIFPSDEEIVANTLFHKRHNLANLHINKLWKCLNEDEKLQVILTEIKL